MSRQKIWSIFCSTFRISSPSIELAGQFITVKQRPLSSMPTKISIESAGPAT